MPRFSSLVLFMFICVDIYRFYVCSCWSECLPVGSKKEAAVGAKSPLKSTSVRLKDVLAALGPFLSPCEGPTVCFGHV